MVVCTQTHVKLTILCKKYQIIKHNFKDWLSKIGRGEKDTENCS